MDTAVYQIVPPAGRAPGVLWLVPALLLVVFAVVGVMVARTVSGARNATFTLSPASLTIRGDLWGREIPASHLRWAAARVVDLAHEPSLAPRRRTAGTAIPGYRSGWFRLADGQKALLYLTVTDRAVLLPTTEGFALLLSPADPDGFVAHVRRVAPAG